MAKRLARYSWLCLLAILAVKCGGDSDSPATPTAPSTTPTRVINLSGNLTFGDVLVGGVKEAALTIGNSGTAPLSVSGLTVTGGLADHSSASWTTGQIAAGGAQTVVIRFAPRAAGAYTGTVIVNGDQTSGTNTIPISGSGIAPSTFSGVWTGSYVVERCDGTGSIQDVLCSSRGVYPPGSVLPIRLTLTQTGNSVSGTFALGQVTGPANGSVSSAGVLTLQGTATGGPNTAVITSWSTRLQGDRMEGNATYNLTNSVAPGVAVMVTRLNGVTK
jgi:hypothetical protein